MSVGAGLRPPSDPTSGPAAQYADAIREHLAALALAPLVGSPAQQARYRWSHARSVTVSARARESERAEAWVAAQAGEAGVP